MRARGQPEAKGFEERRKAVEQKELLRRREEPAAAKETGREEGQGEEERGREERGAAVDYESPRREREGGGRKEREGGGRERDSPQYRESREQAGSSLPAAPRLSLAASSSPPAGLPAAPGSVQVLYVHGDAPARLCTAQSEDEAARLRNISA